MSKRKLKSRFFYKIKKTIKQMKSQKYSIQIKEGLFIKNF